MDFGDIDVCLFVNANIRKDAILQLVCVESACLVGWDHSVINVQKNDILLCSNRFFSFFDIPYMYKNILACPIGKYGSNCALTCSCNSTIECNEDGSCKCPPGKSGANCQEGNCSIYRIIYNFYFYYYYIS